MRSILLRPLRRCVNLNFNATIQCPQRHFRRRATIQDKVADAVKANNSNAASSNEIIQQQTANASSEDSVAPKQYKQRTSMPRNVKLQQHTQQQQQTIKALARAASKYLKATPAPELAPIANNDYKSRLYSPPEHIAHTASHDQYKPRTRHLASSRSQQQQRSPATQRHSNNNNNNASHTATSSRRFNAPSVPEAKGELVFGSHCVVIALTTPIARSQFYTLYVQDSHMALLQQEIKNSASCSETSGEKRLALRDEQRLNSILDAARDLRVPVRQLTKQQLNMLSRDRPHNGVILDCSALPLRMLRTSDTTSPGACRTALADWYKHHVRPGAVFVMLDSVEDPQNVGAILRSVAFLRADGILISSHRSASLHSPTVNKASSAALEVLHRQFKLWQIDNTLHFVRLLRQVSSTVSSAVNDKDKHFTSTDSDSDSSINASNQDASQSQSLPHPMTEDDCSIESGAQAQQSQSASAQFCPLRILGLSIGADTVPLHSIRHSPTHATLLILSNEGTGMRKLIAKECDQLVRIHHSMPSHAAETDKTGQLNDSFECIDSLNVSAAAALAINQCIAHND